MTTTVHGIVAYGSYLPYWRLQRSSIGAALGTKTSSGSRAVASFDEDSTTMAVEASRIALAATEQAAPEVLWFATASPAYAEKTNAAIIHAALGLPARSAAFDAVGAVRSGAGALAAGLDAAATGRRALVTMADVRFGLPGSSDESAASDGAAAFVLGHGSDVIAELVGSGSSTEELLDRWREPTDRTARSWEERFGEHALVPLAEDAVTEALKQAGLAAADIDHLIVGGSNGRAAVGVARAIGASTVALTADAVTPALGNSGTAQVPLGLVSALDRALPSQVIVTVTVADGADAQAWRVTDAITAYRAQQSATVEDQLAAGRSDLSYATYLTWRGLLDRDPPRRPEPARPAAPVAFRREAWKFGFTGSRCTTCGTRHLPPARVCLECRETDRMVPERLADRRGTIATFTVDHLSFSPSPPVLAAVVDYDGGGRFQCELTDVDPGSLTVGTEVEMMFRRFFTAQGVHNYFWKARPVAVPVAPETDAAS